MAERELFNPETGNYELMYDDGIYETQPFGPASMPAPTTSNWTDPDNAPPPWLTDPNADMSGHPLPPGLRWVFQNGQWQTAQMPTATTNNPTTPQSDPNTNPDGMNPPPVNRGGDGMGGFGGGAEWAGNPNWPGYQARQFDQGPKFTYKDFVSPSADSMLQEPGFQFRMDQGRKALESSAAGKGVLRSGGTLKDILGYGQNFASQEYGNVWNRALTEYDTNRNNAADIWGKQYGQRKDQYGFDEDANRFGYNAKQRQAELDAREAFDRWSKSGDWTRDIVGFGAGD